MSAHQTFATGPAASAAEFDSLLRICAALTAPQPLEEQLDSLLREARRMVRAEAGTLYVMQGERLRFVCSQNDARPNACQINRSHPWQGSSAKPRTVGFESLAGYVASTALPLRLADVYRLPSDAPYQFDPRFDESTGYRTCSMLAVPLGEQSGAVLGVMQVINRLDDGGVGEFSERDQTILVSLASVAAVSLRNAQLREELLRSHLDTILRLATAAEFRDGDTGEHIRRVSCYCEAVARRMGQSPEWARRILVASPMHDVGKLGIPDAILNKPGPLTEDERLVMQGHTVIGARILEHGDNDMLRMAQTIARHHHERWDGGGYPDGLAGTAIELEARIAAIADVFDALTNSRVYKPAFSYPNALEIIQAERGWHFDPDVADAFLAAQDDVLAIHEAYH